MAAVDDAAQAMQAFGGPGSVQTHECFPAGTLTKLGLGASDKNANAMIKYASPSRPHLGGYPLVCSYERTVRVLRLCTELQSVVIWSLIL